VGPRIPLTLGVWGLLVLAACRPGSVAEAEARGDVDWLLQNDSPAAVEALGRLADKNPAAARALDVRSSYDVTALREAWAGVLRNAPWGTAMLKGALVDPKRADLAAAAMGKGDPHLTPFAAELEAALVRLSASPQNVNLATALASIGVPAHAAVERRIVDASSRGAMCAGLASAQSSEDARKTLLAVPESARDAPSCVEAVVVVAASDESALAWLATTGEPGLLGGAGRSNSMPCASLHEAWVKALASRPASAYSALSVPLGYAVTRCPAQLDGVLADAIVHVPAAHRVVVDAIDPFASYGGSLHATCAALPTITSGKDSAVIRERASDALAHACKSPG
jgi:hypothetical protein